MLARSSPSSHPVPKPPLQEPPRARSSGLTWLSTQVGVKALRLEHDEQRAPAQEDCREEEVFQHSRAGHPPATPMGSGQGGRHSLARRPGSGSAATYAQTSASAPGPAQSWRPSPATAAARGACYPSAVRTAGARSEGSPSPARDLGHPSEAALGYGKAAPARLTQR